MTTDTQGADPWRTLYACAIAFAYCYRFRKADEVDPHLGEDSMACAMDVQEWTSTQLGQDRGPITFERWAKASLEVFEARLAVRGKFMLRRPMRDRVVAHVEKLRELLAAKVQA